jgi:hypothetical protein
MTSTEHEENAYTLGGAGRAVGVSAGGSRHGLPEGAGGDRLKTAEDRFVVTPNNLTIDAYAILDLADGPVVVYVPTLDSDRWYIVQIADAFDDVILNVGGSRPHVPGVYLVTGPEYQGRVPGDMIQVKFRTNVGFAAVRIAVTGSADLPGAVQAQQGFTVRSLPDYLAHGIVATTDYSPVAFPELTASADLVHFDRLGSAMKYMLPLQADVNDTFVQNLATIGISVRRGFDWQALDESTLTGLRRAGELVHRPAVPLHYCRSTVDQFGHDLAQPLRPDGSREVHRMNNVG